ncbi:MAG TPA: DUF1223 domain-containing protein [Bauldia sp.]
MARVIFRRMVTAVALAAAVVGGMAAAQPADAQPKSVIELFTSQGCSSCPPADHLIADYARRSDVLALSYNVDYWDYLGWKDTLGSHDNSQRQQDYSAGRGDGDVYTPQAVIDGRTYVEGNSRGQIDSALAKQSGSLSVPIGLSLSGDAITVNIGASSGMPHATLWLVMYDRSVTVPIARGENSGKTITYTNVVRKLRPIAMWTGAAMSVSLARSEMEQAKVDRCAVLLQTEVKGGLPGPIIGAAAIDAGP